MVSTDTFAAFARRMAATHGFPYIVVAETPNPIRQLDPQALRARAEGMIRTVIDGFTLPPGEIERRLKNAAERIRPEKVARSSVPI
jgi:hypothetical protein